MSLSSKAMLISLSVSCWTGVRKDDAVVAEIDAKHNATNSGRFSKYLVDKSELEECAAFARTIRAHHYKLTLPWSDNGPRLLPALMFKEYSADIRRMRDDYTQLVIKFLDRYEQVLKPDARLRLGTLYNPEDYPDRMELRLKFDVSTEILPVPEGNDFRVDVGDEERRRIAEELDARHRERQAQAVADTWQRVRQVVGNIHTRLTAEKSILRESLIDNAAELAKLLPGLNVTADPLIDRVGQQIASDLLVDIVALRKSQRARTQVAAAAQRILDMVPA